MQELTPVVHRLVVYFRASNVRKKFIGGDSMLIGFTSSNRNSTRREKNC